MRLLKKWEKVDFNKNTEKIEPYRQFYLTEEEMMKIHQLALYNGGFIESSHESEELLKEILEARSMGSLLYPENERDDWSGFVKVFPNGMLWML